MVNRLPVTSLCLVVLFIAIVHCFVMGNFTCNDVLNIVFNN